MVDVEDLVRNIQKAKAKADNITLIDNLDALAQVSISKDILKKTKVGHLVNKLRKYPDSDISEKAKVLVAKWKKAVGAKKSTKPKQPSPTNDDNKCPDAPSEPKTDGGPSPPTTGGVEVWDIEDHLTLTKTR